MESKFDLISIGDATIDAFITPIESQTLCKLDNKDCLICFSYGDKIPTKDLETVAGGNAANNAVGATRLGVRTAIVLTLGDDSTGNQIEDSLKRENVDMSYVTRQKDSRSNYNTVINYSGERTIFTYHAPRVYQFPENLASAPWCYLTSMGEGFEPFYKNVVSWVKKNPQMKMGFNPGTWQFRAGTEALKEALEVTYILFVNREEAEKLTGMGNSHGKEKELLTGLQALGPKVAVVTDGNNGSYVHDGGGFLHVGVLPVDAYERTGAGDAFGSGCLSALVKGKDFGEALLWGTVNSASVIGYVGPQKGLIKESEMPTWLERAKSCEVKIENF